MAVYTHLTQEQLSEITHRYGRGTLRLAMGIAEGVENSNYLIESEQNGVLTRSILTLYEKRVREEDLPFFLTLMQHLAGQGVPCPVPLMHDGGALLLEVEGRKAAMVSFLSGQSKSLLREVHCRELGGALARLHLAAQTAPLRRANDLSLQGWHALHAALAGKCESIKAGLEALVSEELLFLSQRWPGALPRGIIHADLFPNNVFFEGDRLTGIIDFYFACEDILAYDLAICLNCWCFEREGELNVTKARAMIAAYDAQRPLTHEERDALPILVRGAALRFLLTRAFDWLHTSEGALVTRLNPLEYEAKLRFWQQVKWPAEMGL